MNTPTFQTHAPAYWAKGYSVIPLEDGSKKPASQIKAWSGYCNNLPSEQTREQWLNTYAKRGIGLLLGMKLSDDHILGAIDIDRDDLVRFAQALIGPVISAKIGKKGLTIFVRAEAKLKSTALKTSDGLPAADILLGNKMTVLPPSVHSETKGAYGWVGAALTDVDHNELPLFSKGQLNILKLVIASEHLPTLLAGKGTHDACLSLVAQLVALGCEQSVVTAIITALLPENYSGNSLGELSGMFESAVLKGFEQKEADGKEKASLTKALVQLAHDSGAQLFYDGDDAFASVPSEGGFLTFHLDSTGFRHWLRDKAYNALGKVTGRGPLGDAIASLEAQAIHASGPVVNVSTRVSGDSNAVEIDLAYRDGRAVRITSEGFEVTRTPANKFYRASGFETPPDPVDGGKLEELRRLLHLQEETYRLFLAFLINALHPIGPYMMLLVEGEQGSGKSFVCRILKMLIDPNRVEKVRLPDNERDLMIQAKEYRLLVFDNASGVKAEISDALCALATGSGFAARRLYTNSELHAMAYSRPIIINGISGYASRPDLLERAIPISLKPMQPSHRRTEAEILEEFKEIRPGLLGALYLAVSGAIEKLPKTKAPEGIRMADAARWIAAAEIAAGFSRGDLIDAIKAAQNDMFVERVSEIPLVYALREFLSTRPARRFEGHFGELLSHILKEPNKHLPASAQALSVQIARLRPSLERLGFEVTELSRDKHGRRIRIELVDDGNMKPSITGN